MRSLARSIDILILIFHLDLPTVDRLIVSRRPHINLKLSGTQKSPTVKLMNEQLCRHPALHLPKP